MSGLIAPRLSDITITGFLPNDTWRLDAVNYWTERRISIKPVMVTVRCAHVGKDWHWRITVTGPRIRQADDKVTNHDGRIHFSFKKTRVSDRVITEGHVDPNIVDFAMDAKRRIEAALA